MSSSTLSNVDGMVIGVDIYSEEGANALLKNTKFSYLSILIKERADKIRQKLQQAANNKQKKGLLGELEEIYTACKYAVIFASQDVFALVPQDEIKCLIGHAQEVLEGLANDSKWIQTGILNKADEALLGCLIPYCQHKSFVPVITSLEFPTTLAKFITAADDPILPKAAVCSTFLHIVNNIGVNCKVMLGYEDEKIFKLLESTQLLGQFIRCITQTGIDERSLSIHLNLLDNIIQYPSFVKKKFKPGQPTGDILHAVVNKQSGFKGRRNPIVTQRLQNLYQIAMIMSNSNSNGSSTETRPCQRCNKICSASSTNGEELLFCSKCKAAHYCSRECQIADWPTHKKCCVTASEDDYQSQLSCENAAIWFVKTHYMTIMQQVKKEMMERNTTLRNLVLELDFYAGGVAGMTAPAFCNPPVFRVGPAAGYFEGSFPLEPKDWFDLGSKDHIKFRRAAKDLYTRMTDQHLCTLVRSPDGQPSIHRVRVTLK